MTERAPEWRCFHCDAVFTDRDRAEDHFGTRQYDAPLCVADQSELIATRKERDEYADIHARVLGQLNELRRAHGEKKGNENVRG